MKKKTHSMKTCVCVCVSERERARERGRENVRVRERERKVLGKMTNLPLANPIEEGEKQNTHTTLKYRYTLSTTVILAV